MRRVLIIGVALSLLVAGLPPLSACALLSSRAAECARATAESHCDKMDHSGGTKLSSNSAASCCVVSQAPAQELQYKAAEASPSATIVPSGATLSIPGVRGASTRLVVEDPSPPSLQSLLCTFLI